MVILSKARSLVYVGTLSKHLYEAPELVFTSLRIDNLFVTSLFD
jgi:hypothetical protein